MTVVPTILVVEDDPNTRKMLRLVLVTEGYAVVDAGDARAALATAEKALPDLVQDIVNNLSNVCQLVRFEGEGQIPSETLAAVDRMIQEASMKPRTLGDLETVTERTMEIGVGIDYPGASS